MLLSQEGWEVLDCYCCVIVTGGIGAIIVLLSLEGYEMLLLCYCRRRDRCYYCVIVIGGIGGVIIVLLSSKYTVQVVCR